MLVCIAKLEIPRDDRRPVLSSSVTALLVLSVQNMKRECHIYMLGRKTKHEIIIC